MPGIRGAIPGTKTGATPAIIPVATGSCEVSNLGLFKSGGSSAAEEPMCKHNPLQMTHRTPYYNLSNN